MSLRVPLGQVVAVVGQSGGGKSTIVKLIEHFYELSSGQIILSKCVKGGIITECSLHCLPLKSIHIHLAQWEVATIEWSLQLKKN